MELEPKYIRAYNEKYEVDSMFINKLHRFHVAKSLNIIQQMKDVAEGLPIVEIDTQVIAGVVKCEDPLYFEIEYLNESNYMPVFIDIKEIDVDDYLDHINNNQSI